MANGIVEIIEQDLIQLEIIEPENGQIEVTAPEVPSVEVIISGSSISPDLDISETIETVIVDGTPESVNVDIIEAPSTNLEITTKSTTVDIFETFLPPTQFTEEQADKLLDLIFVDAVLSLSVTPTTFEKNKQTTATWTYTITLNDNTLSSITFDGVDVTSNLSGNQSFNIFDTTSKQINTVYVEDSTDSKNATSTALEPQYYGVSSQPSYNNSTYDDLTELNKTIQSSPSISQTISPSNQYVYFLSTKSNAVIRDGNGFNNTEDFEKTLISVKYADGGNQALYQYRSRNAKTLTNFTYNLT
jgi:hypothetical protein